MTAVHLTSASYLKSSISGHRIHSHPLPITSHPIPQQWTRYPTTKYSMSSHCSSLVPPLGSLYHQHLLASHHPDPPLVLLSAMRTCFTTLTIHDLRRRTRSAPAWRALRWSPCLGVTYNYIVIRIAPPHLHRTVIPPHYLWSMTVHTHSRLQCALPVVCTQCILPIRNANQQILSSHAFLYI